MLIDKIKEIYPQLTDIDFDNWQGTIMLQNDSDGRGYYIKAWNHPTLSKPTDEELINV